MPTEVCQHLLIGGWVIVVIYCMKHPHGESRDADSKANHQQSLFAACGCPEIVPL